jgi:hypothetical protein
MYAVTKTYKDFNGVERTETKLFNLTEQRLWRWNWAQLVELLRCFSAS